MKIAKLEKMALNDAQRAMAADMFYGEGAGTRRKLLQAEIWPKVDTIEGYREAFDRAYESLDLTKYAEMAVKERKALDRAAKVGKNVRALKSGNLQNLTTGVAVVVGLGIAAHATGLDVIAYEESKRLYRKAKTEIKFRVARAQGRNVEKLWA